MGRHSLTYQQARLGANTLRMLAVDAVEKAASGHPGLPMGAADYAFTLWHDYLRFEPSRPSWPNRDRFILSAGHGSMLLYGLLHLFGYDLSMDELKQFRQWGSRTPGHPEYGHTPGVEVTTGPLGQGFANGVGMALASRMAAERFNDELFSPIDHHVYAIVSDGDLMEGISSEAASLAGHLKLGNIIYIYDDNGITIEGKTELAFSENVGKRFTAMGWHVQRIDGHDFDQIRAAVGAARSEKEHPSLIIARTEIAKGSPNKAGSAASHGAPLGGDEVAATRKALGWPDEQFHVPEEVRSLCRERVKELKSGYGAWEKGFALWRKRNQEKARLWDGVWQRAIPSALGEKLIAAATGAEGATRTISGRILQEAAALIPGLIGGSADLEPSTNTGIKGSPSVTAGSFGGRNIHFGIREHAMAAVCNGLALYGCFIPFGSTFLTFSDYCRPSLRLAALMNLQVIHVFTHDSIFLGEDGPTHQPVEHLSALRLIPGLTVFRPADGMETAMSWAAALTTKTGPTALALTRQKVPALQRRPEFDPSMVLKGGYTLVDEEDPAVIIMASGSEVALCVAAGEKLKQKGMPARIVSVPCLERFLAQPRRYRQSVIVGRVPLVAVEAGLGALWWRLLGKNGLFIGVEGFGASAPEKVLAEQFGLTPALVAERVERYIRKKTKG